MNPHIETKPSSDASLPSYVSYVLTLILLLALIPGASAQEPMSNGGNYIGTISTTGDTDAWEFSASSGDQIVVRASQVSGTNGFILRTRIYDPDGNLLNTENYNGVHEHTLVAGTNGNFTVLVDDESNADVGTGIYRLYLAKIPGEFMVHPNDDGGSLPPSGGYQDGTIGVPGELDLWTFSANAGDRVVLRWLSRSSTNVYLTNARIYSPDGTKLVESRGLAEYEFVATDSGTFTILITSENNLGPTTGTGTYRIYHAKLPSEFIVPPDDDGGSLPLSGGYQDGTVGEPGDLDLWTFSASAGDRVVLRWLSRSSTNVYFTNARIYSPDGTRLAESRGLAEYEFVATNSGNFTILITSENNFGPTTGTGTYRIHCAKFPGPFIVPPGDEGGWLVNEVPGAGAIDFGDLDVWAFQVPAGNSFSVQLNVISNGWAFYPTMRLYGPDGVLQGSSGGHLSQVSHVATNAGTYALLLADYYDDVGAYQLTATGIVTRPFFAAPQVSGTNLILNLIGSSHAPLVLYTTTNLTLPPAQWTPLLTNQFNALGQFTRTNPINLAEPQRFFLLDQQ